MVWLRRILIGILVVSLLFVGAVYAATFHPDELQDEAIACPDDAPVLQPGQTVKTLSWNVQYMAGKDYVFYYDLFDGDGPDTRPTSAAIDATFAEVARVIADESPDVILLQEVDDGAARTDGEDQLARLLEMIPDDYVCNASAFYWKAVYAPHPKILGSVGMKLSTVSRYRIDSAVRHALPIIPANPLFEQFGLKRGILETHLPVEGAEDFVAFNTHFDAFAQGTDTMERQVAIGRRLLDEATEAGTPWIFGGDLNLLPPGRQYDDLNPPQQRYYAPDSELSVLTDAYPVVPTLDEANGSDRAAWFTHFPNDPVVTGVDRTIDFVFHSPLLELGDHSVRLDDTLDISDHMPVIAELTLP